MKRVVIGLAVAGLATACGGSSSGGNQSAVQPIETGSSGVSATVAPLPAEPTKCAKITPNPTAKGQPMVPDVKGKPSSKLVVKDVTKGHGPVAHDGADVAVTYIGVSCTTGKVFDASYLHGGQPFDVSPLGNASVIQGWNDGLVGVKAGGVRELVIPASLGYGAQGSPPTIKPNETLIFLITVKSVKNQ